MIYSLQYNFHFWGKPEDKEGNGKGQRSQLLYFERTLKYMTLGEKLFIYKNVWHAAEEF